MNRIQRIFQFILLTIFFWIAMENLYAQPLQPGFDAAEYRELLLISIRTTDLERYYKKFPEPTHYSLVYQSDVIGLGNLWQLWESKNSTRAVISIRGTTRDPESVLSNLYAAMVPAKGMLRLSPTDTFYYELAPHPRAAVHVGWLISMAILSRDILPKIEASYKKGIKNFLLIGHSQGGAINYLLTAYLYNLQKEGKLPKDIRFKTYCSAPPKPGNLYFAYYYESLTQNGWSYTVINSVDWVPETPISIQTLNDFNHTNPFTHLKEDIQSLSFPKDVVLGSIYNKLDKPTKKAQQNYEKYLGEKVAKFIHKFLPDFVPPEYVHSNHYVRTGTPIILYAKDDYFDVFPDTGEDMLRHHNFEPYLYLLNKYFFPEPHSQKAGKEENSSQ